MDAEYQAALSNLVRRARPNQVRSTLTALTFVLGPRRITRYLAGRARAVADELARIDPPADAAAEHAALVRAARNASSELDELAARDDLRAFERFDAVTELKLGDLELTALEAKGYRLRE
jgi:methylaspartate ammonia-lyase